MGRDDWYRRTSWTAQDKQEFFARLGRSRSEFSKAQYLRIQALYLQRESNPPLYEQAIELIDHLLSVCPHSAELAGAHMQKAQCLEALGRLPDAAQSFLSSLSAEREATGVKTRAPLEFAMFVIRHRLREYYDEVVQALEHIEMLTVFPEGQYQACAALAIIAHDAGNKKEARRLARMALSAGERRDSGLKYHPRMGLVESPDPDVHKELRDIAGA